MRAILILCRSFGFGILLFAAAGCGSGTKLISAVPVKGEVFFQKTTPCAGAFIVFQPKSEEFGKSLGGKSPTAYVKEDGSFQLTTYVENDGAPPGEYNVTIVWETKKDSQMRVGDRGNSPDRLEGKYGNPQSPLLFATVEKGKVNTFRFDVE